MIIYWVLFGFASFLVSLTSSLSSVSLSSLGTYAGNVDGFILFLFGSTLFSVLFVLLVAVLTFKFVVWVLVKLHVLGG